MVQITKQKYLPKNNPTIASGRNEAICHLLALASTPVNKQLATSNKQRVTSNEQQSAPFVQFVLIREISSHQTLKRATFSHRNRPLQTPFPHQFRYKIGDDVYQPLRKMNSGRDGRMGARITAEPGVRIKVFQQLRYIYMLLPQRITAGDGEVQRAVHFVVTAYRTTGIEQTGVPACAYPCAITGLYMITPTTECQHIACAGHADIDGHHRHGEVVL